MKNKILFFFIIFCSSLSANHNIQWSAPTTLSNTLVDASEPLIVMDSNGNASATWLENTFVMAKTKTLNDDWSLASTLSSNGASSPRLAIDGNGNVTALWAENGVIKSSTKTMSGTWGSASILSDQLGGASSPQLAVDASGNAVAVWIRNGKVESATKLSGGNWSAVDTLSSIGNESVPYVAIGENGRVVAVWHTVSSGADVIFYSRKTLGETWSTSASLFAAQPAFHHNYPIVAVDNNGNAIALWYRYTLTGSVYSNVLVLAATLSSTSTTWSFPTVLSSGGLRNPAQLYTRLGFDSSRNALALWTTSYNGETFNIETALLPSGGAWETGGAIALQNLYSFEADMAVNSNGSTVLLYMLFQNASPIIQSTETNISGIAHNFFSLPQAVSTGNSNGFPRVASSLTGTTVNAAGIWISFNGSTNTIQAATGSKILPTSPTNLSVMQNVNHYGVFNDYYNTLSWQASTEPDVVAYNIYRNGIFFTQVSANTLQIIDHNTTQNGAVTYGIVAVDSQGSQSLISTINFP